MSATKDSDTDLGEVFPDMKTIAREADQSRRRAKLENALNASPVMDAALKILRYGLKEGEDPLYYAVPPREPVPKPGPPRAPREAHRRQDVSLRSAVIALIAVFGPLTIMWVLFVRPQGSGDGGRHVSSAPAAAPSAPTIVAATAEVVMPPPSSAPSAAPASSSSVDWRAAASPPSARPASGAPRVKGPAMKAGQKTVDDNPEYFQ